MNLNNITSNTITLAMVIDVVGSIPIIVKLKQTTKINPLHTGLTAFCLMLSFLFIGTYFFKIFNISENHFAVAGSMVMLFYGIKMMFGLHFKFEENETTEPNSSFYPTAFPLLVGAGVLSTILSLKSITSISDMIIPIILNSLIIYAGVSLSNIINNKVKPTVLTILERISGVITVSIGIKMLLTNITLIILNVK